MNVITDETAADKRYGLDLGGIAEGVDDALAALHHVEDAVGPQTLTELGENLNQ